MTAHEELLSVITLLRERGSTPPFNLLGSYGGSSIRAQLTIDGELLWRDEHFTSPSVAAGRIITRLTGQRTGDRNYLSINGWTFWNVELPHGDLVSLRTLREALAE
jgi:hypothetical protein